MPRNPFATLGLLLGALLLSACDSSSAPKDEAPLATVTVETIEARPLSISSELSGRIAAPRIAEVRARVAGVVQQRTFREGSDCLLYTSPSPRDRQKSRMPSSA